jgi:hypothetical protein
MAQAAPIENLILIFISAKSALQIAFPGRPVQSVNFSVNFVKFFCEKHSKM